ncbi:MAG: hypothetical protein GDA40_11970 [Rhodobacteraceae bacterium]|nr:hypothetical protein [Paracoccaceae bacterium]
MLFAAIDFHHIGVPVAERGVQDAFIRARDHTPDYARFFFWFWQMISIDAGRPEAEDEIRAALIRAGWTL